MRVLIGPISSIQSRIDILAKFNNHHFVGLRLKTLLLAAGMIDCRQWL